jgi:hypothetical protein
LLYLLLSFTTSFTLLTIFYCYLAISFTTTLIIISESPCLAIIFHLPSSACSVALARAPPVLVDGRCFVLPYLSPFPKILVSYMVEKLSSDILPTTLSVLQSVADQLRRSDSQPRKAQPCPPPPTNINPNPGQWTWGQQQQHFRTSSTSLSSTSSENP